jgi:hypothetical protein
MGLYKKLTNRRFTAILCAVCCLCLVCCNTSDGQRRRTTALIDTAKPKLDIKKEATYAKAEPAPDPPKQEPGRLDTVLYKKMLMHLVHDSASARWPVKTAFPLPGALLPFKRIVAYYGNFYSTHMGVLGEYPPDEMLRRLMVEVKKWEEADPQTPVLPAIHYIAVTAQGSPGKGGKYRMRMPFQQIDKALELSKKVNGILFLDIQVGLSTIQEELPQLEPYLKMPNVHCAIDPEFSMKPGRGTPGGKIGTYDASDINYVSNYLVKLVREYNLPPKILVVHRFTHDMVTNYKQIALHPEVQVVMDMDGWGFPAKKVSSYHLAEVIEPVQFTGFKLFYKNDIKTPPWKTMMTPKDVLKLYPRPVYIQYQ